MQVVHQWIDTCLRDVGIRRKVCSAVELGRRVAPFCSPDLTLTRNDCVGRMVVNRLEVLGFDAVFVHPW